MERDLPVGRELDLKAGLSLPSHWAESTLGTSLRHFQKTGWNARMTFPEVCPKTQLLEDHLLMSHDNSLVLREMCNPLGSVRDTWHTSAAVQQSVMCRLGQRFPQSLSLVTLLPQYGDFHRTHFLENAELWNINSRKNNMRVGSISQDRIYSSSEMLLSGRAPYLHPRVEIYSA